ncbi:glycine oxidase ThiO [Paenibacillus caseinilyticus]|uniref:glycine oxidase n=1 Tax=Paenibacillus mucilaginosus K02 TaxID=997761 RepID=I0BEW1_9BACL|nr:glycine oxidase ThiO [Paenibacillus mucilaginosus]AFH60908.2 glycine oxidase [Paenibacillus mucilaginosus K02]
MNTKHLTPSAGRPKAIIIGGGVIGCAAAFELSEAGFDCTVLDKGRLCSEATTAAAGMLGAQVETHHPGPFYELCRISQGMYRRWTDALEHTGGVSTEYIAEGILRAALTEEDEQELRSRLAWIQDARWCTPDELRELEPALSPKVRGGLHFPADHQVHPAALARALKAALVKQGCTIREETPVFRLLKDTRSGRITGVQTAEGPLYADTVVLAAGAWSPALTEPLGLPLPMFPVKGQCISVKPQAPLTQSTVFTKGCYIVPKADGSCLVGATQVEAGFDKRATAAVIADLHARASALLPALADAEFLSTWAGLRPGTRDGLPFMGTWETAPGLIFATGHYRNGILLAPAAGRIVRQLALGEKPLLDLAPFDPARHLNQPAPAL